MKKRLVLLLAFIMIVLGGCGTEAATKTATNETAKLTQEESAAAKEDSKNESNTAESEVITFVDDMGETIILKEPAKKIISLYSVHTENLYALGLKDEIIGVSTSDKYPADVENKTKYTYKDDPEVIIAAGPDLVIIRTMIANNYPEYVQTLKDAGITVVTLYVQTYDQFDSYIEKLGMMTGKSNEAKALLVKFHSDIENIKEKVSKIETEKNVYFESIGKKFKTATPESFAGTALSILNLNNIAKDIEHDKTTTVVTFGEENLLAKSDEIDVYIAQKGAMNKSVSLEEINSRPGFNQIKAVKEGNVIIINEKLISGATTRYIDGLNQLITELYPEI